MDFFCPHQRRHPVCCWLLLCLMSLLLTLEIINLNIGESSENGKFGWLTLVTLSWGTLPGSLRMRNMKEEMRYFQCWVQYNGWTEDNNGPSCWMFITILKRTCLKFHPTSISTLYNWEISYGLWARYWCSRYYCWASMWVISINLSINVVWFTIKTTIICQ